MTTELADFKGPKRGAAGGSREAEYLCLHCERPVWRAGGVSSLGRHLAAHGGVQAFPAYRLVDAAGWELDGYGDRVLVGRKPRQAGRDGDGWVRTRVAVSGVAKGVKWSTE